jgi:hypothetical protein
MGCEGLGWIHLAEYRVQWRDLVNTVKKLRVAQMEGNFLTGFVTISLSVILLHGVLVAFLYPTFQEATLCSTNFLIPVSLI